MKAIMADFWCLRSSRSIPSRSAAWRTRNRIFGSTFASPRATRDTVAVLTFASFASSRNDAFFKLSVLFAKQREHLRVPVSPFAQLEAGPRERQLIDLLCVFERQRLARGIHRAAYHEAPRRQRSSD